MVIGTAGAGFTENARTPLPEWNEMFFYKWGYARVVAHNSTYLTWEWVESSTGTVFDRMAISQITDFKRNPYWAAPSDVGDDWITPGDARVSGDTKSVITSLANFFLCGYGFFVVALLFVLSVWGVVYAFFPPSSLTAADTPGTSTQPWRPWTVFLAKSSSTRSHETYTALQTDTGTVGQSEKEAEKEGGRDGSGGREGELKSVSAQVTQNPLFATTERRMQSVEEKGLP